MKTISTPVFEFDELEDSAKDRARDWYRQVALDYEWWDFTYEDAARVGLEILGFECYRKIETRFGGFMKPGSGWRWTVGESARAILANHGKECDTYKLAQEYFTRKQKGNPFDAEEWEQRLGEEYLSMLNREYEYLLSDESVDESIRANEYTFTADGRRFG
jgi:hypothetical protein